VNLSPVSDVDGRPLEEDGQQKKAEPNLAKFTKSKWESVDETELEAQGGCSCRLIRLEFKLLYH